jgi:ABC-type phosphate transport system substrate-binding protein
MKKMFLVMLAVIMAAGLAFAAAHGLKIAVIVGVDSPLAKGLGEEGIKKIFLGKTIYAGGRQILPVNMGDGEVYEAFLEKFIGQTAGAYKNYWIKQVFATGVSAPDVKDTSRDVIDYVSENKYAIGYVAESELKGKENKVKVIAEK